MTGQQGRDNLGGGASTGAGQPSGGTLDEEQVGLPDLAGGVAADAATLGGIDGTLADAAGAASGAALEEDVVRPGRANVASGSSADLGGA